ncbi:hypothetical protein Tco_0991884 [Tanacetum coccineum]|uniref:Uncharacterized protein n=1 Tax=Tanacetum coccineum TaxID=301880 RepID=A0ABQ5F0S5_9ASTR
MNDRSREEVLALLSLTIFEVDELSSYEREDTESVKLYEDVMEYRLDDLRCAGQVPEALSRRERCSVEYRSREDAMSGDVDE